MIADIRFWEQKASEGHYAIPHFNVWNAEMLMGVIDAAEELRAPIIISFGTGFTGNTSFEDFCYMMESMAKKRYSTSDLTLGSWSQLDNLKERSRSLHELCNA